MAACLGRSFQELPPTHEMRLTVSGMISDRDLSSAVGRFLRRLKYRLKVLGAGCEYLLVNEWSHGGRHTHFLVRTEFDLTPALVRELWAKTVPGMLFTHHCDSVCNPQAIAKYIVKHLKDDSKKELAPSSFKGRIYAYSRRFFIDSVVALWKEQLAEWYPQRQGQ